jgi:hypothetical protein
VNIAGVSNLNGVAPSGSGGSGPNVADLQKQIVQLQQEIIKEQQSKDDAKTKVQLEQAYQMQIAELQAEIQQARQQQVLKESGSAPGSVQSESKRSRQSRSADTARYLDTQA